MWSRASGSTKDTAGLRGSEQLQAVVGGGRKRSSFSRKGGLDHSLRFLFWIRAAAQLCWGPILQPLSLEPAVLSRAGQSRWLPRLWKNRVGRGGWIIQGKKTDS